MVNQVIRISMRDGNPVVDFELTGCGVYLDNDSIIGLAKGPDSRRERFVQALIPRGSLLFSMTNAIEVAGPQGDSAVAVRTFLNSIGHHWIPLELNFFNVLDRESRGEVRDAPFSRLLADAYLRQRISDLSPTGTEIVDLSASNFFHLGAFVDWGNSIRSKIRTDAAEIDAAVLTWLRQGIDDYRAIPKEMGVSFPPVQFDPLRPATFAATQLVRLIVRESKHFHLKKNDGLDFLHAVLAIAYSRLTALDKHWQRRVNSLPGPHHLAKVYYRNELDQLIELLESLPTA